MGRKAIECNNLFIDNLRRRRAGEPLRKELDPEVLY